MFQGPSNHTLNWVVDKGRRHIWQPWLSIEDILIEFYGAKMNHYLLLLRLVFCMPPFVLWFTFIICIVDCGLLSHWCGYVTAILAPIHEIPRTVILPMLSLLLLLLPSLPCSCDPCCATLKLLQPHWGSTKSLLSLVVFVSCKVIISVSSLCIYVCVNLLDTHTNLVLWNQKPFCLKIPYGSSPEVSAHWSRAAVLKLYMGGGISLSSCGRRAMRMAVLQWSHLCHRKKQNQGSLWPSAAPSPCIRNNFWSYCEPGFFMKHFHTTSCCIFSWFFSFF